MNRNQCIFDEKCLIKSNFHWVVFQPMKSQAPILKYISGNLCVLFRTCKTLVHKRKVILYLYVITFLTKYAQRMILQGALIAPCKM